GVPTVASPTGAVRDVHVAGLQVVETRDVAAWAHAMQQATSLSRAGVRDALPTWRETRRLHYALYREVAQT
ncbi:MAG: glycosyltransferase family 1 protein, partial [Sulfobacillus thermotolerans]|nr:glycosyltransferase family 1 protein [Sulfobacillus thermotolerans]